MANSKVYVIVNQLEGVVKSIDTTPFKKEAEALVSLADSRGMTSLVFYGEELIATTSKTTTLSTKKKENE